MSEANTLHVDREKLQHLWDEANNHCVAMCGQYLPGCDGPPDDWDWNASDWNPPMPADPNDTIEQVIEYLKGSL